MRTLEVKVSDELLAVADKYAREKGETVEELVLESFKEKLEDLEDFYLADQAYNDWVSRGRPTVKHDDLWKSLDIDD
jgi:RHH-type rel operon transcriptional repressor/antitoxin RelB